jgi:bifunctional DNase/RNase
MAEALIPVTVHALGMDRGAQVPVLVLKEVRGSRIVPILIGPAEASAIAVQLGGVTVARPSTYDLLAETLRQLGGRVRRVAVTELQGSTYLASIFVDQHGGETKLDARPSDAIALALRTDARIDVAQSLLEDRALDGEEGMDLEWVDPSPMGIGATPSGASEEIPPQSLVDYLRSLSPEDLGRFQP